MRKRRRRGPGGPPDICICPNCGFRKKHERGVQCSSEVCPKCGSRMIGKWE